MSAIASLSQNRCPRCGARQHSASAEGLCPRCLVAMNLAPPTDAPTGAEAGNEPTLGKPPPTAPLPLAEVARRFPRLEILGCLGCGGMGVVYKARQPHLNRFVALKILAPGKEQDPSFAERFAREAQTLARLNHPHIVTLYEFGKVDGLFYLLMEHVDGMTLRQLLQSKKLTPEEALAIVPKICEALQYAHEHGVVHRDIKPENVLLNREGWVKIADFGIAKMLSGTPGQPTITRDEQVIGTPHYMAPEQVEQPQRVDHRADIYSLGVVLYEMLTGELPLGKFAAPSQRVQIDVRLDEVVLRALEKDPERRYQHASQVKTAVETITTTPVQGAADASTAASLLGFRFGTWGWLQGVRWSTRLLGMSLLLFFAVIFGLYVLGVGLPPLAFQSGGLRLNYLAIILMLLGFILGWKFEGTAAVLIAAGWALWHSSNGSLAWSMFHLALLVAVLYAFCWWATRGRRTWILAAVTGILAALLVCGITLLPTNIDLYGTVLDAVNHQPIPHAELAVYRQPVSPSRSVFPRVSKWLWELTVSREPSSLSRPASPGPARSLSTGDYALHVGWYTAGKQVRVAAPGYATMQVALGSRPGWIRRIHRDFVLSPTPIAAHVETAQNAPPRVVPTPVANPDPDKQQSPEQLLLSFFHWGQASSEHIARLYSEDWLPRLSDRDALFRLGCALYDAKMYPKALAVFRRMEAMGSRQDASAWQGHLLDLLGQRSQAIAAYRQALGTPFEVVQSQYGIVLNQAYLEQRLKTPFTRVENQMQDGRPFAPPPESDASNPFPH